MGYECVCKSVSNPKVCRRIYSWHSCLLPIEALRPAVQCKEGVCDVVVITSHRVLVTNRPAGRRARLGGGLGD